MEIGDEVFVVVISIEDKGIKDLICHDMDGAIMDVDEQIIKMRLDWISQSGFASDNAIYSMKKVKLVEVD